ncbi:hypothetical protein OIO90_004566 [Microbotryomycetes sp. JL221]|nr:hypothetical protein OIO90_004566 [Microbotryomycetes sp. JL221]
MDSAQLAQPDLYNGIVRNHPSPSDGRVFFKHLPLNVSLEVLFSGTTMADFIPVKLHSFLLAHRFSHESNNWICLIEALEYFIDLIPKQVSTAHSLIDEKPMLQRLKRDLKTGQQECEEAQRFLDPIIRLDGGVSSHRTLVGQYLFPLDQSLRTLVESAHSRMLLWRQHDPHHAVIDPLVVLAHRDWVSTRNSISELTEVLLLNAMHTLLITPGCPTFDEFMDQYNKGILTIDLTVHSRAILTEVHISDLQSKISRLVRDHEASEKLHPALLAAKDDKIWAKLSNFDRALLSGLAAGLQFGIVRGHPSPASSHCRAFFGSQRHGLTTIQVFANVTLNEFLPHQRLFHHSWIAFASDHDWSLLFDSISWFLQHLQNMNTETDSTHALARESLRKAAVHEIENVRHLRTLQPLVDSRLVHLRSTSDLPRFRVWSGRESYIERLWDLYKASICSKLEHIATNMHELDKQSGLQFNPIVYLGFEKHKVSRLDMTGQHLLSDLQKICVVNAMCEYEPGNTSPEIDNCTDPRSAYHEQHVTPPTCDLDQQSRFDEQQWSAYDQTTNFTIHLVSISQN